MKPRQLSLAVVVVLLLVAYGPALVRADTIYFRRGEEPGIKSVSGTIVRETDDHYEITTARGRTVTISRDDVFQIVRDIPSADGGQDPTEIREQFPAASAVAEGQTFRNAPSHSTVTYHYGFTGGLNIANVRADPQELEDDGSLRSYAFGFWLGKPLWRNVAIRAEALFSMKGDSETAAGFTASTRLGYIDLPVLAKAGFLQESRFRPSLLAGPSLGFNLSANSKLQGASSDVEVDVKDRVSSFDLGLVVGAGLDFDLAGRTLGVDLRYNRGLSDVGDGAAGSARNEVFAVMWSIGLQ